MMQKILYVLIMVLGLMCIISTPLSEGSSDKLVIYTVNYPLQYFAERIAGEHATVVFPAPAEVDPAYWMPDAKTIADYQKADLILLNGSHYAKWIEKVTLPLSKMINTTRKLKGHYIKAEEAVTHSHGPKGKHAHEDAAFTVWLDFDFAVQQAKAIKTALSRKRPALKSAFDRNYSAVEKDLLALDREIKEITSTKQSQPIIASHPVYQYFAGRYGLHIKSVHWEPDELPDAGQWTELKKMLKGHPARWMIWEGEPLKKPVEKLQSMGVRSIVYEPCGNAPEKGDFLSVMKQNVKNLRATFR